MGGNLRSLTNCLVQKVVKFLAEKGVGRVNSQLAVYADFSSEILDVDNL